MEVPDPTKLTCDESLQKVWDTEVAYTAEANEQTWLALQVEYPAAVANTRAIVEVEGADLIFFGPGDYSVLDGRPGDVRGSLTRQARATVAEQAIKAGKRFGTLCFGPDDCQEAIDQGAKLITQGSDIGMVRRGLSDQLAVMQSVDHSDS